MQQLNYESSSFIFEPFVISEVVPELRKARNMKKSFDILIKIINEKNLVNDVLVIGGLAVILNKYERFTQDIDLLVYKNTADILKKELESLGFSTLVSKDKFSHNLYVFQKEGFTDIDVILAVERYQRLPIDKIKKNKKMTIEGNEFYYASIKILIELKIRALKDSKKILERPDALDISKLIKIGIKSGEINQSDVDSFKRLAEAYTLPEFVFSIFD